MTLVQDVPETDWANQTNVHMVGLALTVVLAFGMLVLPRRWAPLMLLALACFIPAGQRVVVLTLDFTFLRMLVLVGGVRIFVRREWASLRVHNIDLAVLAWAATGLVAYSLLHGSRTALVFKLGTSFDALGLYFLFRFFVRSWADLDCLAKSLSVLAVPMFLAFLFEQLSGRNLFSIFGGVPEFTEMRGGRLRCQGAFLHPILAGCFWAAALPLIAARLWGRGHAKAGALLGTACAGAIVLLSASSTPAMAAGFALVGGVAFVFRRYMGGIRVGALVGAVGLHLVMKAPVWHLLSRVNVIGGSTGWHRYYVIDATIKHFSEWWLMGTPSTSHWGRGLGDMTNQYGLEAVRGGLLALLLFLGIHVLAFKAVGRAWRLAWPDRPAVALAWALGVSLFAQCVSFLGTAYFDQSRVIWYLVVGCIASMSMAAKTSTRGAVVESVASTASRALACREHQVS